MTQPQTHRLAYGGRIDRSRTLRFTFDGRAYEGHPGDTLASALMASGERLIGRSFKYHRPRGIVTAGPEEPCALVELRTGACREPNTRATVAELYDGLEANSQNRWPSLALDISAINQLVGRFLPAGFYYKTFMWPASFWEKVYEPIIRRAAGLGRAATATDPDEYESIQAHCDVLVVGSGAAGLAAARAAGAAGARVILADQDFELGGGLLLEPEQEPWRQGMLAALSGMPEVRLLPRTTVFGFYEHDVLGAVERVSDHLPVPPEHGVRQRVWTIRARQTVLATGSTERPIAFPNNDRPGVMLASAAMTYVRRFGVRPGERAVIFANNDIAYNAAFALHDAGIAVAAIVDVRKKDSKRAAAAADRGIAVKLGSVISDVKGSRDIHGISFRSVNGTAERVLDADLVCVSGGWNPAVHLQSHTRARLTWDNDLAAFLPGKPVQAERSAGSAAGVFGIARCAADGAKAGLEAAAALGFRDGAAFELPMPDAEIDPKVKPFWEVKAKGKAFVDLQNDVTTDDIRLAHREGYTHIEHAKRYTTHSMATDQGRFSGILGTAVLAEARGETIEKVGVPTFRPYVTPVTWGAMAGRHAGHHLQPVRRTPLHHWHVRNHGIFLETGLWMRPLYYSATRETGWDPILKEARAVRQAVGICDVSTLGKIDIQGRDAGMFMDRLYTNTFSTLAVGKARYGLMLREDGMVFDDGTTSRLSENRYLMTTTTAKAAEVLAHMEFYHQTVWPDLDVRYCTVTDQWAQMSVAGPKTRLALQGCVEGLDLSNEAFPFMGVGDATIAGCPVRIYRVSFSGEMAYEVATPAGYGERVWEAILEAGKPHGILPYGLEALGLLRIEKGHVAGPELNGQTTARDLGFDKMMKKKGDFIGRVNGERPRLMDSDRPRLVGIRAVDPSFEKRLRGGAHIVDRPNSKASLGWATSITRSVELERWLGLAMVRNGPDRIGQRLYATYPLKNEVVEIEICSPHHVDPENLRVRA
ncbi:MAG: sarcosine oxidase subunit alpha family protein [Alphaproteobacteria bacterium]|nr:sarcosine oxidase subunit alpha family protein [Alphaproteobacteria bacterium]